MIGVEFVQHSVFTQGRERSCEGVCSQGLQRVESCVADMEFVYVRKKAPRARQRSRSHVRGIRSRKASAQDDSFCLSHYAAYVRYALELGVASLLRALAASPLGLALSLGLGPLT